MYLIICIAARLSLFKEKNIVIACLILLRLVCSAPSLMHCSLNVHLQHLDDHPSRNMMRYIQAIHQYVHFPSRRWYLMGLSDMQSQTQVCRNQMKSILMRILYVCMQEKWYLRKPRETEMSYSGNSGRELTISLWSRAHDQCDESTVPSFNWGNPMLVYSFSWTISQTGLLSESLGRLVIHIGPFRIVGYKVLVSWPVYQLCIGATLWVAGYRGTTAIHAGANRVVSDVL